jgi:hypothetical protein
MLGEPQATLTDRSSLVIAIRVSFAIAVNRNLLIPIVFWLPVVPILETDSRI